MNQAYEKFQKSIRGDVKLKIALDEYINGNDEYHQVYYDYLHQRRRAAWEVLIREENLEGLEVFAKEQWLKKEDVPHCLELASKMKKKESLLWLLSFQSQKNLEETSGSGFGMLSENLVKVSEDRSGKREIEHGADARKNMPITLSRQTICEDIKMTLLNVLQNKIPSLGSAFPYLEWICKKEYSWGTDGTFLYYNEEELISFCAKGFDYLARKYLHLLFHCLYLHMISEEKDTQSAKEDWNLACDVAVEWALDRSDWFPLEKKQQKNRDEIYQKIEEQQKNRDTKSCLKWVQMLDEEQKEELKKEFCEDQHSYWYQVEKLQSKKSLEEGERLANTWGRARKTMAMQSGAEQLQKGERSGAGRDLYQIQKKKTYDYGKFLRQFAVTREEMQLDMESIDYIPYHYGLERYGNILLIEPLETTEVNRLEEFVIAIDTSGSCSGAIVKRFLEETYGILSARENFFRKMRVHIIQCDSMIQDHKIITCEEDWKKYQENVQIQGLGGTDFTPVFQLVDKMIEKKEIRKLKGLMYFTDGDGIFPKKKPSYETAFVFLNHALEKQKIPDWAIRLNLDVKID